MKKLETKEEKGKKLLDFMERERQELINKYKNTEFNFVEVVRFRDYSDVESFEQKRQLGDAFLNGKQWIILKSYKKNCLGKYNDFICRKKLTAEQKFIEEYFGSVEEFKWEIKNEKNN